MAGFLYYIPNQQTPAEAIRAAGLEYAFDGPAGITGCPVRGGPDGGEGIVIAGPRVPAHEVGFFPDRQTWRAIPHPSSLIPQPWLGRLRDVPILPADLTRRRQLRGHLVTLGDGREWLVPVARGWTEEDGDLRWYPALPRRTDLDPNGDWTPGPVVEQYAALWEIAQRWQASRLAALSEDREGDEIVTFDFAGIQDAALAALQANYRVGKAEVVLLGLFNDEATRDILEALVDRPTMLAWLVKKNPPAPAGASIAAGPADLTEATVPP